MASERLFRNSYWTVLGCRRLGVSTCFLVAHTDRHGPFPHQRDRTSYDRRTLAEIQGRVLPRLSKDHERLFPWCKYR